MNLTKNSDWEKYHKIHHIKKTSQVLFGDIFRKFLDKGNKSILEIGCGGGEFLYYFSKNYGYKPFGIDYANEGIKATYELFKTNNFPGPTLYKEDFFRWNPQKYFDIVCSFGFIEHFEDLSLVIKKHADLVKPGGTLILSMPHFSHAQYVLHWLIDRENLRKHNTKVMNLKSIRKSLVSLPFTIECLSYYRTFEFWTEKEILTFWEKIILRLIRVLAKIINSLLGPNIPNPLLSPHIICIAKRNN